MQLPSARLLPPEYPAYYLHGEDRDALFEAAEALLEAGERDAIRLRVDVSELGRIEVESSSQGLFGQSCCYALVRNGESASPKQTEHLLKLATGIQAENRIIICAAEISAKKALHQRMQAETKVVSCAFLTPAPEEFQRWFGSLLEDAGIRISDDAVIMTAERLHGMRQAARRLVERLQFYDNGEGKMLGQEVVGDLLGEHCPEDLGKYCEAVAQRSPQALSMLRRLFQQRVAEVQVLGWLSGRIQQLLMYRWYAAQEPRSAAKKARLFGAARQSVPEESRQWQGQELALAMWRIHEAEVLLKGASIEDKPVVLERLTLDLVQAGRLQSLAST
ncbi:MAG: DNA polymerase III subunit delta [Mariprofundaceae bacterium]